MKERWKSFKDYLTRIHNINVPKEVIKIILHCNFCSFWNCWPPNWWSYNWQSSPSWDRSAFTYMVRTDLIEILWKFLRYSCKKLPLFNVIFIMYRNSSIIRFIIVMHNCCLISYSYVLKPILNLWCSFQKKKCLNGLN